MGLANKIIGVIIVMFILGAIGATAWGLAGNGTAYTEAGASATVALVMGTLVPILGGIAVALYLIPRRS